MRILCVDAGGNPKNWMSWEDAAFYVATGSVLWQYGELVKVVHGGINAISGKRTVLELQAIISVQGRSIRRVPRANYPMRDWLFRRDNHQCAYCGEYFSESVLTKDHMVAESRGGASDWLNQITACKPCNARKDDMTMEEAGYTPLYSTYKPSYNEILFLDNPRVTPTQWEFLSKGLKDHSRAHILYNKLQQQNTIQQPVQDECVA